MKNKYIPIITDLTKFDERVTEIMGGVSFETIKAAVADIKRVLNDVKESVCLCAPQIGYDLRLFVVKTAGPINLGDSRYKVFLNPMIVNKEGLHMSREVNLSIPDREFIIPRYDTIHTVFQEIDGRVNSETYKGFYAEVVQQMIEMLDGITIADYGLEIDENFDKASKEDQAAIIEMYLKSLKIEYINIKKEITEDKELNIIDKTIDFTTEMLKGNIKPIDAEGNVVENFFGAGEKK